MSQLSNQSAQRGSALLVSFDDDFAARFIHAAGASCPTVHVSPLARTVESTIESLRPSVVIFDLQTVKTENVTIFDIITATSQRHPHLKKIAVGYQSVPAQVIAAMKAGAGDFLDRDATESEIAETVARHCRNAPAMASVHSGGRTIVCVGARPNEGEAFLSSNLAAYLATSNPDDDVLLMDLDLEPSELEINFDVEITYTLRDALVEHSQLDKATLFGLMTRHKSGLYLLPLATRQHANEEVTPQELAVALGLLRTLFDTIVINGGCLRNGACQPYLLPLCDNILVLATQELASVRAARDLFGSGARVESRSARKLVIGDLDPEIDLAPGQISKHTGIDFMASLPPARVLLANGHNLGTPAVLSHPSSKYAKAVSDIAAQLFPEHAAAKTTTMLNRLKDLLVPA